jgi:methanogenic corrinoid protein MtbC1
MTDSEIRDVAKNTEPYREDPPSACGLIVQPTSLVKPSNGASQRFSRLLRTIEVEIIPRLVLARRAAIGGAPVSAADGLIPGAEEVAALARLVLAQDGGAASSYVESLRTRGTSIEVLYLELLAPAARRLGELWTADICDFAEVTVGLCRLQQVLHELGPAFRSETDHLDHGRRVLLLPVPGEQHSFGVYMVAEFFRRAGWDVWSGAVESSKELVRIVRRERFAVIGLSVSADNQVDTLSSSIRAVRRASRNRGIGVLVGGPVFVEHPELVPLVGADATAVDGRQAVQQARNLLALLPSR